MLIYASPQNKKSNIPKKRTLRTKAFLRCNNIHAQKKKKKKKKKRKKQLKALFHSHRLCRKNKHLFLVLHTENEINLLQNPPP